MGGPVIVKMGGSLITFKDSPFTPNVESLNTAAGSLAASEEELVVIHGGGSYGHEVARRYGLSSLDVSMSSSGVSETRMAMHRLSMIVIEALHRYGLSPFLFHVHEPDSSSEWERLSTLVGRLSSWGLTPLTHGDVAISKGGFRIVSGDEIAFMMARRISPSRVVFLMDVPGVLEDVGDPGSVIEELGYDEAMELSGRLTGSDATGGISTKLKYASMMAGLGIDVYMISGNRRQDILNAVRGRSVWGTVVRGGVGRTRI